ncbi:molybdopterin-binding domain-containing protein [Stieleria varia]|uniref:Formyltransferase/hydrolase complex Fhc subunit B n=1 Tax=Stieleria varia TaxID=2528005 RepID=A0A5C6B264_9BACT|nr:hypothetical protein [Stieleria varia]TWU06405.1 hypothetical protein Pla52n_21260 [Stieleria varia]
MQPTDASRPNARDAASASDPVVCPFCPLHCDDLLVDDRGQTTVDCEFAKSGFGNAAGDPSIRRGRKTIALDRLDELASELGFPDVPLVSLTSAPLNQSRRWMRLHQSGAIRLTSESTASTRALATAIRRDGVIAATIADVRQHADLIVTVGSIDRCTPRLRERLSGDRSVQWRSLGSCISATHLADLLMAVRHGSPVESNDSFNAQSQDPCTHLSTARYIAFIVADDALADADNVIGASLLLQLIVQLNQQSLDPTTRRRAVLMALDPLQSLKAVLGWNGIPLPMLGTDSTAVDIRIGNPLPESPPAKLQIGGRDPGEAIAEVFIPASQAGVHVADMVIRGDGTVTLPLQPVLGGSLSDPVTIVEQFIGTSAVTGTSDDAR